MPQVKNAFYVHGNSVVEFKPDKTVRIDDYFLVNNQTKTRVIGLPMVPPNTPLSFLMTGKLHVGNILTPIP